MIENSLNTAIDAEKEAEKLYIEAASITSNSNNKQVYLWLAREEIGHQILLSVELNNYKKEHKFVSKKQVKGAAISTSIEHSEFPSFIQPPKKSDTTATETDIIIRAMKAEAEASSFYKDLAGKTSDAEGKCILKELAQIEKGHLALLTEELEWMNKGGGMFLLRRFTLPPQD